MEQMLTSSEVSKILKRHIKTIQRWDRHGLLKSERSPSGRRLYKKSIVDSFCGCEDKPEKSVIAYCRVSSQAQKPDLKNQRKTIEEFCVATGRANVKYVEEVGGGLNFKRKKFLEIVDLVCSNNISEIIIAHKDRFARFGFDLLQYLCDRNSCKLTVINIESLSPEQEMVQDLMTIIHCFSSRLYGLRNYRKALKKALKNDFKP